METVAGGTVLPHQMACCPAPSAASPGDIEEDSLSDFYCMCIDLDGERSNLYCMCVFTSIGKEMTEYKTDSLLCS